MIQPLKILTAIMLSQVARSAWNHDKTTMVICFVFATIAIMADLIQTDMKERARR